MKGMRMVRMSCFALAVLALTASGADAAIIDWQAELQRCRTLRENVVPLLQAGEGISAVGRSNRFVRRCIWIQRMAVRKKIAGAEAWEPARCMLRQCERSEAIQEFIRGTILDSFAGLAMTMMKQVRAAVDV